VLSRIIRLRLSYEGTASQAPASLFLKMGLPERIGGGWNGGCREVAFYNQVAAAMLARLVPRCFEAAFDEATQAMARPARGPYGINLSRKAKRSISMVGMSFLDRTPSVRH
jgi:hypothetical protein